MQGVMGIWWGALALVAASVLWMLQLILTRRLREAAERRQAGEQRKLQGALLGLAAGEPEARTTLVSTTRTVHIAAALVRLQQVVKGRELERVGEALREAGVEERLQACARRGPRRDRLVCIEALCAFPAEDVKADLLEISREPDPGISLAALRALRTMGHPVSLADLARDAYKPGGRTLDRLDLAGRIAEDEPEQAYAYILDPQVSDVVRIRLIDCVAESRRSSALAPMVALARSEEKPAVRAAAVRGLGKFGYCNAEDILADALASPHWEVRAEAASAAPLCRASSQVSRLGELLDDDVWIVRYNAGRALLRMATAGRRKLAELAEHGDVRPRRVASFLLSGQAG